MPHSGRWELQTIKHLLKYCRRPVVLSDVTSLLRCTGVIFTQVGSRVRTHIVVEEVSERKSTAEQHIKHSKQTRAELRQEDPLNLNILLSGGKETNKDSLSNGE